jgi:hypothetical protein
VSGLIRSVGVREIPARDRHRTTPASVNQMANYDTTDDNLSRSELAWELVELFGELRIDQINEVLAKNVPIETLEFFASYAKDFANVEKVGEHTGRKLPNLMLLGYLLRVLEDTLIDEPIDLDS